MNDNKILKIVENNCPYCNGTFLMNKKSFANHIRWCKDNPKYEEIRKSTILKNSVQHVPRIEYNLICENCNNSYTITCTESEFKRGNYKKTCSSICAKELTQKKTTKEKNFKISQTLRENFSKQHKSYNIEKKGYEKTCPICQNIFFTIKKEKICCSSICAVKYRKIKYAEYAEKKQLYKSQCEFKFALNEYKEDFDFSLVSKNGWYKATNHGDNLNGISRDHIISINDGFKLKIDPYYISHPCNCELMIHRENAKKQSKSNMTKDELIKKINEWNKTHPIYKNKIIYYGIEEYKE